MLIIKKYQEEIEKVQMELKREKFDFFYGQLQKKNIVVIGIRQIGKSTLVKQLAKQYAIDNRIDFDYILHYNFKNTLVSTKELQNLILENDYKIIVFDEIQTIENWSSWCQSLIDLFPETRFIITGSNAKALSSESMFNRAWIYNLNPLSFSEYIKFWNKNDFESYLAYGSYPKFNGRNDEMIQYTEDIEPLVINRMLSEEYKGSVDMIKFKMLMNNINNFIGNELKIKTWSDLKTSRITASNYLLIMEDSKLINKIYRYQDKNDYVFSKVYYNDKSMVNLFNRFEELNNNLRGSLIENVVFNHLHDKYNLMHSDSYINYFIGNNRREIDFVVEPAKLLIEVKYHQELDIDTLSNILNSTCKNDFEDFTKIVVTNKHSDYANGWYFIPLIDFLTRDLKVLIDKINTLEKLNN